MSAKPSRTFRANHESLERRETPSHNIAAAAAVVHAQATASTTRASLLSQGFAQVTQSAPTVRGQQVVTTLYGNSKALGGHYTAVVDVFNDGGKNPIGTGTGTITTASGDTIDLEVRSRSLIPYFSTNPSGKIQFNIVDGTGKFANASGRGAFVGYLNFTNSFRYELRGNLKNG